MKPDYSYKMIIDSHPRPLTFLGSVDTQRTHWGPRGEGSKGMTFISNMQRAPGKSGPSLSSWFIVALWKSYVVALGLKCLIY